jgi:hypothetical protein
MFVMGFTFGKVIDGEWFKEIDAKNGREKM